MATQVTLTHILHAYLAWWALLAVFLVLMGIMLHYYKKGLDNGTDDRYE